MRDLQPEIPARFPTHYPFRAREFLNRRVTLQLSAEISFEQRFSGPRKILETRKEIDCVALLKTASNAFGATTSRQERHVRIFTFVSFRVIRGQNKKARIDCIDASFMKPT